MLPEDGGGCRCRTQGDAMRVGASAFETEGGGLEQISEREAGARVQGEGEGGGGRRLKRHIGPHGILPSCDWGELESCHAFFQSITLHTLFLHQMLHTRRNLAAAPAAVAAGAARARAEA